MANEDPFERAAKREHLEEARREAMAARVKRKYRSGTEGAGQAFRVFFVPYVVWALLRAANHTWGEPSTAKAVTRFFIGSGWPFAWASAWLLFLLWIWMIGEDGD